jgi:hypothetical protein
MEYLKMTLPIFARLAIVALFLGASPAYATPVLVTVDTSALVGVNADLAFDLVDGGPPANTITLSGFTTNGTLGAFSSSGTVSGAFPGIVTLGDLSFFSEYLQNITLGSTFSFVLDSTNLSADLTSFPDGFSLFLLDHATGLSLVTTSDPTGANALFLWSLGTSTVPDVYSSDTVHVTTELVNAVPEPSTLPLAVVGLIALISFSAFGLWRTRNH